MAAGNPVSSCVETLSLVYSDCLMLGIFLIHPVCCCNKLFNLLRYLFPELVLLLCFALQETVMKAFASNKMLISIIGQRVCVWNLNGRCFCPSLLFLLRSNSLGSLFACIFHHGGIFLLRQAFQTLKQSCLLCCHSWHLMQHHHHQMTSWKELWSVTFGDSRGMRQMQWWVYPMVNPSCWQLACGCCTVYPLEGGPS